MNSPIRRREFLTAALSGVAAMTWPGLLRSAMSAPGSRKPNVILILADDYGMAGVGCYGGDFKTPHLDAMAAGGARFEQCYSEPLCAPSRVMLMTGRFPFRTGSIGNSARNVSPRNETIIPKMLQQAGYATAVAGKWSQLQFLSTPGEAKAWGFDEYFTWDHAEGGRYWQPALTRNGKAVETTEKDFGPDLVNNYVVDFIERKKDEPFFVYYPTPLIHSQLSPTPDGLSGKGLLADNIAYMDKLIGKLLTELDRLKLSENTLILFTGDNGLGLGGKINGRPIHGDKGSMTEGGCRVPLIAQWKGVIPAGRVVKDLVELSDFYATIAEVAGGKLPEGVKMDSNSFAPQLKGEAGKPRPWVFVQLVDAWYVRSQRWKLTQAGELYDMKDAPFAETLVPADTQDVEAIAGRKELQAALDELRPSASKRGDHATPARAQ
jgi:arylsulfatase A